jgi:RNA polymerase sigma factor (TIGR02999 family)
VEGESITGLLGLAQQGQREAFDRAFSLIHAQLRQAARAQLRNAGRDYQTLSATALINEAWLKLSRGSFAVRDREHFIALAAHAMRQIIVDHARRACADKRGGQFIRITLTASLPEAQSHRAEELVLLDTAMQRLATVNERLAKVVEWRYFGGMTEPEIAGVLGLTERTVRSDWRKALAFLSAQMSQAAT